MGNALQLAASADPLAHIHHLVSTSQRQLASGPRRDEVLASTRRYSRMAARDERHALPRLAWRAIAIRLWAASHQVAGDYQVFVRDRATDAHHRADVAALYAGAAS